jgi:protocatechuate 3,4-dioxygenase alpha subunit
MSERLIQTGSQTVGPFFHYGLFFGGENVLVDDQTQGEQILLEGLVLDGDGSPVPDAMVEIWQADANGIFNHPADPNHAQADPHFRGFGRADTRQGGKFQFRTAKPSTAADGVTPYINVRIFARGLLIHAVTRIYFADEPGNHEDAVLNAVDPSRRATLLAVRNEVGGMTRYCFNICLQGANETVFFDV